MQRTAVVYLVASEPKSFPGRIILDIARRKGGPAEGCYSMRKREPKTTMKTKKMQAGGAVPDRARTGVSSGHCTAHGGLGPWSENKKGEATFHDRNHDSFPVLLHDGHDDCEEGFAEVFEVEQPIESGLLHRDAHEALRFRTLLPDSRERSTPVPAERLWDRKDCRHCRHVRPVLRSRV
eukprot:155424-Rhodomonas_salina.2